MKNTKTENNLSDIKLNYLKKYIKGPNVLDVGSGNCHYSKWLIKQNSNLKIVAVDKLEIKNKHTLFNYLKLNLEEKLPFNNKTFNSILAFDVIEHIQNENLLLTELYRICQDNGILIGSVPNDNDKFLPDYNLTFYHRSDITHKRYYTPACITSALKKSGFLVERVDELGGVNPQIISEFFPHYLKFVIKKKISILRRVGLIKTDILKSDLFFIAKKACYGYFKR